MWRLDPKRAYCAINIDNGDSLSDEDVVQHMLFGVHRRKEKSEKLVSYISLQF